MGFSPPKGMTYISSEEVNLGDGLVRKVVQPAGTQLSVAFAERWNARWLVGVDPDMTGACR